MHNCVFYRGCVNLEKKPKHVIWPEATNQASSMCLYLPGGHAQVTGQDQAHCEWGRPGEAEEVYRGLWPGGLTTLHYHSKI